MLAPLSITSKFFAEGKNNAPIMKKVACHLTVFDVVAICKIKKEVIFLLLAVAIVQGMQVELHQLQQ